MTVQRIRQRTGDITSATILEQIHSALAEHPDGVRGAAWISHAGTEDRATVTGMLIVAFRLLAKLRLSREESMQVGEELHAMIEAVRDEDLYVIFYRGMSMVLRPRGIKLPKRRFLVTVDDAEYWHARL